MGKIWLQTSDERLIHLPVVGDDVNTPDDAVKIPTSVIVNQNRCYGQQIEVDLSGYGKGTVTIDLRPDGITGSCNQCGVCCSHPENECLGNCNYITNVKAPAGYHVCQHLTIAKAKDWGKAENTTCFIYDNILNTFKGCAYPPKVINPLWTNCGYSF